MNGGSYDAAVRRDLERALHDGQELACPGCQAPLARHPVPAPAAVSYVRHRLLVICPRCHRSATLDLPRR
jgi:hypothetical protein